MTIVSMWQISLEYRFFFDYDICECVISGNRLLLSYDSTWEKFIDHCEDQGCMVDGDDFPVTACHGQDD